jgi:demethylmenaquinone methyltransferase / 2-methoxy-6-polyprenyl-1,4-benzoquinol methylase
VNNHDLITPYGTGEKGKKKQVTEMFDNIAGKYDFLNHFLSFNIDKIWRRKSIKCLKKSSPKMILDVATGTGDFAVRIYKSLKPEKIIGIDISEGMLDIGRKKIEKLNLSKTISFQQGDSENINFPDNCFDALTAAFGVRNFENLEKGLTEMNRVLKPEGEIIILEFSTPDKFPVKQFYRFYSKLILPFFGKLFSKDKFAYSYLPESVEAFPYGKQFEEKLTLCGFRNVSSKKLSFGISTVYYGKK